QYNYILYLIDGPQALKSGRILGGSQTLNWWLPSIRIISTVDSGTVKGIRAGRKGKETPETYL
ncbi:hypothetical protein AALD74_23410, partial [Lachnospiraceae bacterium 48-21]